MEARRDRASLPLVPLVIQKLVGQIDQFHHGLGCSRCLGKGYAGRQGVFELFEPTTETLEGVAAGLSLQELRAVAMQNDYRTLRDDGFEKVKLGLTTIEEVIRVSSQ